MIAHPCDCFFPEQIGIVFPIADETVVMVFDIQGEVEFGDLLNGRGEREFEAMKLHLFFGRVLDGEHDLEQG